MRNVICLWLQKLKEHMNLGTFVGILVSKPDIYIGMALALRLAHHLSPLKLNKEGNFVGMGVLKLSFFIGMDLVLINVIRL